MVQDSTQRSRSRGRALDQAAEIDQSTVFRDTTFDRRCGRDEIIGHTGKNIEPGRSPFVKRHLDTTGGIARIQLQVVRGELLLIQKIENHLALRILTNAAQKPNRTIEPVEVVGKIEGCTTQTATFREHIEKYFSYGKNQNRAPFSGCVQAM